MSSPDLHAELRATRRELAAARRALQDRRTAQRRPISGYDTVHALSAVLQHSIPAALQELRTERDRLARDLGYSEARRRTAQNKYSSLRYHVWRIAQEAFAREEISEVVFEELITQTMDSEDDREYEERGWVE
jgi:hypothetical protein